MHIFLILPIIAAAIPAVAAGVSAIGQGLANTASHDYNTQMYVQQRKDALADWNMQNEYNAPSAQMARLKTAGLNPNLVYGNGNAATTTTNPNAHSGGASYNPSNVGAPLAEGANQSIASYQQAEMQAQQLNNLQTVNTVNKQDALLREAQRDNVNADTAVKLTLPTVNKLNADTMAFDLGMKQELKQGQLTAQQLGLRKSLQDIDIATDQNVRAWIQTDASLREVAQRILASKQSVLESQQSISSSKQGMAESRQRIAESKQRVLNEQQKQAIDQFEINLNKEGFTRHDPYYIRASALFLQKLLGTPSSSIDRAQFNMSQDKGNFFMNGDGSFTQLPKGEGY